MSALAEVAKAIADTPDTSVLLALDPPLRIIGVQIRPPAQLAVMFSLPGAQSCRGETFEYLQPGMPELLADMSTGHETPDTVATVVLANLREVIEAHDMGLDRAIQDGVVRLVDVA